MSKRSLRMAWIVIAVSCMAVALSAHAADPASPTRHVYGIDWFKQIKTALEENKELAPPRPVLVLQTLGDLDGFC